MAQNLNIKALKGMTMNSFLTILKAALMITLFQSCEQVFDPLHKKVLDDGFSSQIPTDVNLPSISNKTYFEGQWLTPYKTIDLDMSVLTARLDEIIPLFDLPTAIGDEKAQSLEQLASCQEVLLMSYGAQEVEEIKVALYLKLNNKNEYKLNAIGRITVYDWSQEQQFILECQYNDNPFSEEVLPLSQGNYERVMNKVYFKDYGILIPLS